MRSGKCGRARRRKGAQTPVNIGRNAPERGRLGVVRLRQLAFAEMNGNTPDFLDGGCGLCQVRRDTEISSSVSFCIQNQCVECIRLASRITATIIGRSDFGLRSRALLNSVSSCLHETSSAERKSLPRPLQGQ